MSIMSSFQDIPVYNYYQVNTYYCVVLFVILFNAAQVDWWRFEKVPQE